MNHIPPTPPTPLTGSKIRQFWRKVKIGKPDECWPWQGRTVYGGYGMLGHKRAHHISYELRNGPLLPGQIVRHTCDNPPCCNPNHLIPGTRKDNVQDQIDRHRQAALPTAHSPINTPETFWARVAIASKDDCWPWQGRKDWTGRGRLSWEGKPAYAHRIAYLLTYGHLPGQLKRTCTNFDCCNPAHLTE